MLLCRLARRPVAAVRLRCRPRAVRLRRRLAAAVRPAAVLAVLFAAGLLAAAPASARQGATPAAAAEQEPPPASVFAEVVDVEIVNVDVRVTGRDGQPIHGLGREDFVVLRDGRPVEVVNFYAVENGRPAAEPEPGPAPELAAEPGSPALPNAAPDAAPPDQRLWLVVYVDNYNLDPLERDRVLPALRSFLSQSLRPEDRAMLVTFDRTLEVRVPFTDREDLLLEALDEVAEESGFVPVRRREQQDLLKRIDRAESAGHALLMARAYAEELRNGVDVTVRALERLVESLAGLPGRKALLHVSSGVPMLAGEEMFHVVGQKFGASAAYAEIGRHDTTRAWERVDRAANAHRVVFYTLDAGGMRGMQYAAAEYEGLVTPHLRRTMDSVVPENLQSSLRLMAAETGGLAILNRNEVAPALDEVRADLRSYYSLGIRSAGVESARHHEIEVRLREERPGVTVRHRGAYRSKTQQTLMQERLRSALAYAHETNPLGVVAAWGRPEPQGGRNLWIVPVRLEIPLRDLVLVPVAGGKHELRLELYAGAAAGGDEISEIDVVPMGLRIADEHVEAARGESFVHTHRLMLRSGRHKVGLAVLDLLGREWSVVSTILDIGG